MPKRFILPPTGHPHCCRVNDGVLLKQVLDVLGECVGRIDAVKPVSDVAEMWVELVWGNVLIANPRARQASWQTGRNNDVGIPKAGVMGADVSYDCQVTKKCPALVRYIHKGREAAAGSIDEKIQLYIVISKFLSEKVHNN